MTVAAFVLAVLAVLAPQPAVRVHPQFENDAVQQRAT
jgi:hypothetical protein